MQKSAQTLSLSIVIPAYNEADCLEACLTSIGSQTVQPDEVIVVDNNSTDATETIARRFGFVTLVKEKHQGIVYAHHAGFDVATSNLITRIDADCVLPPTWVEQVKAFYTDPGHASTTLVGSGTFYNLQWPALVQVMTKVSFILNRLALGHFPGWGPNLIIPRAAWEVVSGQICYDNDIFDDVDLSMHLHANRLPIAWRSSLVVQAKMRHYESLPAYYRYLRRGAETHKRHGRRLWPLAFVAIWPMLALQYPALKLLDRHDKPTERMGATR